ncbi:MAG: transcription factor FapR [Bacillota bacterium]|nr:transcription factor FapR [Bacillota bacterium]
MAQSSARRRRQAELAATLVADPFLTDEDLARRFDVSVQTVRLDRLALGIPELRERLRLAAGRVYTRVRSLGSREIVGELVDIEPNLSAISILATTEDMVFEKTRIVRGHHLFGQAESLALAIVNAEIVVTGLVNVKYTRPVQVGERLIAKAEVIRRRGNKHIVLVVTRAAEEQVLRAKFVVVALESLGGQQAPRQGSAGR